MESENDVKTPDEKHVQNQSLLIKTSTNVIDSDGQEDDKGGKRMTETSRG